jgi:hypothetical protein
MLNQKSTKNHKTKNLKGSSRHIIFNAIPSMPIMQPVPIVHNAMPMTPIVPHPFGVLGLDHPVKKILQPQTVIPSPFDLDNSSISSIHSVMPPQIVPHSMIATPIGLIRQSTAITPVAINPIPLERKLLVPADVPIRMSPAFFNNVLGPRLVEIR